MTTKKNRSMLIPFLATCTAGLAADNVRHAIIIWCIGIFFVNLTFQIVYAIRDSNGPSKSPSATNTAIGVTDLDVEGS